MSIDFNYLRSVFKSNMKAQEILLLFEELKPVVRQGYYDQELPDIETFCNRHKLFLIKSSFKIQLADPEEKFSNKGIRYPEQLFPNGMRFVYFSTQQELALLAAQYEFEMDHKNLGLLLGYPECCIEFFKNNFSEQHTNLELRPTNPYTNLTRRKEDCVILSHFPCSSDCQKSIMLAKAYLMTIEKHAPEYAKQLFNALS